MFDITLLVPRKHIEAVIAIASRMNVDSKIKFDVENDNEKIVRKHKHYEEISSYVDKMLPVAPFSHDLRTMIAVINYFIIKDLNTEFIEEIMSK